VICNKFAKIKYALSVRFVKTFKMRGDEFCTELSILAQIVFAE